MQPTMLIPLGQTAHVAATEFPATWTSTNPDAVQVRPSPSGRHCALVALAIGACEVHVAVNGHVVILRVDVGPEVIGYRRLKLVGRDL